MQHCHVSNNKKRRSHWSEKKHQAAEPRSAGLLTHNEEQPLSKQSACGSRHMRVVLANLGGAGLRGPMETADAVNRGQSLDGIHIKVCALNLH